MKKINIAYWIFTALLAVSMTLSALPDALNTKEAVTFMNHLGYPPYITPYLGILKLLGVVAILVPGFPRIREWAYAGFTFDLAGALYSLIAIGDPLKNWILFPVFFGILFGSYIFWHKKLKGRQKGAAPAA